MKSRPRRDLGLIWQAALIVVPLGLLSAFSLYFVREDKAAIEREARERAAALAPELSGRVGQRVTDALKGSSILRGSVAPGRILSPNDYPRLPVPADWVEGLKPGQAKLWSSVEEATYQRKDLAAAQKALTALLAADVQRVVRANVEFRLLQLDASRGVTPGLSRKFVALAKNYPGVLTESGTPLPDLSLLLALRSSGGGLPGEFVAELARSMQERPSFLMPELLEAAEGAARDAKDKEQIQSLKAAWTERETTLSLLRPLLAQPLDAARPGETWVEADARRFLALSTPVQTGWQVSLISAEVVERTFASALGEDQARLPTFAAASVEMAGRRWRVAGDQSPAASLASASGSFELGSTHLFALSLDLTAPELLYAPYRRRLWLTAALILSAAGTALLGLASLWRNYRRQVRLSEMKSNFVSSVSHELRAPIAAVRLMAESLDGGRITGEPRQKEYLRLIVQECRRLASLVENVLDFSRIDQNRKQYSFEPVEPAVLVEQTVALMEASAAERRVRLELAGFPSEIRDLRPCWDGEAVRQGLVNLLDNAIKHSPEGAEVRIELEAAGDLMRIWVSDRGEGIPAAEQVRIFELFYRRGSELRRETKGVGIGLSIVKHIAEAHHGRVVVQSAVGEGSRFALELPLSPQPVKESE